MLPSKNIKIVDSGVFWPLKGSELFRLTGEFILPVQNNPWIAVGVFPTSDHRLVWVDTRLGRGDDHDDDDDD